MTTIADTGPGSLRQAILDANATAGADTIAFNIPGDGVQTIAPVTALPVITDTVTIDGYTQPGSSPNTLAVGDNAVLLIELSGANLVGSAIVVQPPSLVPGSTLRGLVINAGLGVFFLYSSSSALYGGNKLVGCFLGTTHDGSAATPGGSYVFLRSWTNTVGTSDPADRNLISGSPGYAVSIFASKSNVVTNNYIGTDASGSAAIANAGGVSIGGGGGDFNATGNTIVGNLVSGNTGGAIGLGQGSTSTQVDGNLIGTDATGLLPMGNGGNGVSVSFPVSILLGSPSSVTHNVIAYNGGNGVEVNDLTNHVPISGNSIHDNGGLGIAIFVSNVLEPPSLSSALTIGSNTIVQGTTDAGSGGTLFVELFSSPSCDPSGYGEGATSLGVQPVSAGSPFTMIVPAVAPGQVVTATATTTEFSACALVTDGGPGPTIQSIAPGSGASSGGTAFTITGSGFQPGATVAVGGVAAGGAVVSDESILVAAPAVAPGSLNDVTVTNPNFGVGTLFQSWFSDFLDVPQDDGFHSYVEQIFRAAITAGCGGGLYCRDTAVRRDQMAVFLLKAEHGAAYLPPGCKGIFGDTPCPGPFTDWVEQLAAEGITSGCGAGVFCPGSPVRRDQMAAFLLKAQHGAAYVPPACMSVFPDVDCPSPFADWIEQLAAEGVTSGCGGGNYCPSDASTRGQMAVFLSKTFELP